MAITYTAPAVEHVELTHPRRSPMESDSGEGFQATRILRCAWASRHQLSAQLQRAYEVTSGSRTFRIGDKYPYRDGVFVRRVTNIEGVGKPSSGSGNTVSYPQADLIVEYAERQFDPDNDGGGSGSGSSGSGSTPPIIVAEEEVDGAGEFLTLPNKKLYWDSSQEDPIENPEAPGLMVSLLSWSYSFSEDDSVPVSVLNALNKVNSGATSSPSLGLSFGAEEVLFHKLRVRRQSFADGTSQSDVTLVFLIRPGGWNKFYRSANQSPQVIYDDSGTEFKPYVTVNLEALL